MDRVQYLIKLKKMDGFDVNAIYQNTKNLKPNQEDKINHDFNYTCEKYLEKIKYFA